MVFQLFMIKNGMATIPLVLMVLVMLLAVPAVTFLGGQNQDTRNKAAYSCSETTRPKTSCTFGAWTCNSAKGIWECPVPATPTKIDPKKCPTYPIAHSAPKCSPDDINLGVFYFTGLDNHPVFCCKYPTATTPTAVPTFNNKITPTIAPAAIPAKKGCFCLRDCNVQDGTYNPCGWGKEDVYKANCGSSSNLCGPYPTSTPVKPTPTPVKVCFCLRDCNVEDGTYNPCGWNMQDVYAANCGTSSKMCGSKPTEAPANITAYPTLKFICYCNPSKQDQCGKWFEGGGPSGWLRSNRCPSGTYSSLRVCQSYCAKGCHYSGGGLWDCND